MLRLLLPAPWMPSPFLLSETVLSIQSPATSLAPKCFLMPPWRCGSLFWLIIPSFNFCPHLPSIHVLPLRVPYTGCAFPHIRHCHCQKARARASGTPKASSATSLPRVHKPLSPTVLTGSLASYTKFILLDIEDSRENINFFSIF